MRDRPQPNVGTSRFPGRPLFAPICQHPSRDPTDIDVGVFEGSSEGGRGLPTNHFRLLDSVDRQRHHRHRPLRTAGNRAAPCSGQCGDVSRDDAVQGREVHRVIGFVGNGDGHASVADSVQTALADTMRPAMRVATGWTTPIRTGVGGECRR